PVPPILLGLLFAFATFFLASLLVPGGLGGGDVKLAALIGAVLGFPLVLGALIVGALASAVTIVVLITIFRRTLKDSIPYAPFLCLGVLAILIYRSTWVL
ncbi:MAG TPA: prepilin peptidase, partial [Phototrophicaceae bacterium]|nr:prepilin peptidase [Phototrophicaceae bacterium]